MYAKEEAYNSYNIKLFVLDYVVELQAQSHLDWLSEGQTTA